MTLASRLASIEERVGAKRPRYRFIRVMGGAHSEEELWGFLNSQGIVQQPGDLVIDRELWVPGDEGLQPADREHDPLRLLSVNGVHHPIETALAELDR